MEYIVIDLEFNQPFNFPHGRKTVLVPECPLEIIQIGAVKLDSQFEIIGLEDFLVRPSVYKRIHPYVKKITGLAGTVLLKHAQFPSVYEDFLKFLGDGQYVFCVWGSNDIKALFDNVTHHKLDELKLSRQFIDVQQLAGKKFEKAQGVTIGLKSAVELMNLSIDEPFHYALNDARYTAKIFQLLQTENMNVQTYSEAPPKPAKNYAVDITALYKNVEKEYGRKLSKKERRIMQKVYLMGRSKQFDRD